MEILYKCKYILFFYLNNTVILYFFKIEIFCKEFIRNYTCNAKNYCRFFYYNQVLLSYSNFQIRYKDWKIDFFDIYTIYTLSLNFKKIRERRIRSLLSAGLNLSHMQHTFASRIYYCSISVSIVQGVFLIYVSLRIGVLSHVCQLFDVIKGFFLNLFELDLNFWIFTDIFRSLSRFSSFFVSGLDSHQSLLPTEKCCKI